MSLEILPLEPRFQRETVELIVSIQRDEFGIDITAAQQPDLHDIPDFYQVRGGGFWVALADGRVVGTISLLDIGDGQGALRKMFVAREFRGARAGTAQRLLDTLLGHARNREMRDVFLGTTSKFLAAHRFYAKNGFHEIAKSDLPPSFAVMAVDDRFFHRRLEAG
ncbi:MAG TPA: GNAT family N-acetyltransferase [Myxococcota bacterium]|nr:GNAT family N-acetyltransferase [Myxococcota bacterium]